MASPEKRLTIGLLTERLDTTSAYTSIIKAGVLSRRKT